MSITLPSFTNRTHSTRRRRPRFAVCGISYVCSRNVSSDTIKRYIAEQTSR